MGKAIIKIENLTKDYKVKKEKLRALDNINLEIEEGEIYGIIGLSGAGKSTLIRCMNFLEKPTSGKVFYKGIDLSSLKNKELLKIRQNIGMIFQSFNLLEQRNVLDHVLFPLEIAKVDKKVALKRAYELLEEVGLSDKLYAYPNQLSGGQKQRVAIARALMNNPSVLLCDEATSALDPSTTKQILELLKNINKKYNITIVVITHQMQVIESICSKVAIIDHSQIIEEGEVKDIFINPKSETSKKLILPEIEDEDISKDNIKLRLIFDGNHQEPLISKMILQTKVLVNIIKANVKTLDERTYGVMIILVSNDEVSLFKIENFLLTNNVKYQKED